MFTEPISHITDATLAAAFDEVFAELTKQGSISRCAVTENQAPGPLVAEEKDTLWRVAGVLEGPHGAGVDGGEGEGHTGLVAILHADVEKGSVSPDSCTTSPSVCSLLPLPVLTSTRPERQATLINAIHNYCCKGFPFIKSKLI